MKMFQVLGDAEKHNGIKMEKTQNPAVTAFQPMFLALKRKTNTDEEAWQLSANHITLCHRVENSSCLDLRLLTQKDRTALELE